MRFIFLQILFLFFLCVKLQAQGIIIADCNGFTRAVKALKANQTGNVQLQVQASSLGQSQPVTLTNTVTGQTVSSSASNGLVSFAEVPNGTWTIGSLPQGAVLNSVTVTPVMGSAVTAGTVVGGTTVVGGGAATVTVTEVQAQIEQPQPTPTPTPTPTATPDCRCEPDEEPTPISSFFGNSVQTQNEISPAS